MTATFLLTLDVGSDTDLLSIAEDISHVAEQSGMIVQECKPWARQTFSSGAQTIAPPTQQTPPPIQG